MFKGHNESLHYKMYKSGKSWIFAGLTAGLLLTFGGETALADTAPTTDDPAAEQPTTQPDETTKTTVALKNTQPAEAAPTSTETPVAEKATDDPAPDSEPNSNIDVDDSATTPKDSEKKDAPAPVDTVDKSSSSAETSEKTDTDIPTQPSKNLNVHNRYGLTRSAQNVSAASVAEAAPAVTVNESIDDWMPNKTLQQLVANQLGKSVDSLTKDDVANMKTLAATHVQYSPNVFVDGTSSFDLKGLELATNLTYLDLSFDPNTDFFSSLMGPKSYWGDVTSLSSLAGLTNLQTLILAHNRITDISPLANLKNLTVLDLSDNRISDFSKLDAAQFTNLNIANQLIMPDTVQQIDPLNPTITLSQLVKLPQNFNGQFRQPFDQEEKYATYSRLLTQNVDSSMRLTGDILFYRSGTALDDYKVLDTSGTVQFTNIKSQVSPYLINYNDWVGVYEYPYVTPIQHPYKYYLRANLQVSYIPAGSSTKKSASFTVFIPYDNPKTAGDLTVKYLDTDGKSIQADQVVTGKLTSDNYDLTAETTSLKGYTFDHADGELTGPYTTDPQTISLYFTKDATKPVTPVTPPVVTPTTTITVTTHYVDQNGQSLYADHLQTGQAGDHYTTEAINIPGFSLTTTPANASGTLGAADVVVTYVYNKLDEAGNTPKPTKPTTTTDNGGSAATVEDLVNQVTTPGRPQADDVADLVSTGGQGATVADLATPADEVDTPAKVTVTTTASPAATTTTPAAKTTLPQANEQTRSPLIGLALLLGALVGFGLKRRKQR